MKVPKMRYALAMSQLNLFPIPTVHAFHVSKTSYSCGGSSLRQHHHTTPISTLRTKVMRKSFHTASTLNARSTFEPPTPPSFNGQAVFPDINMKQVSSCSIARNQDPNSVFVVTGASRGIGLQIVKDLMERSKGIIVACCRSPNDAEQLNDFASLSKNPDRILIHALDLENQDTINEFATTLKERYNRVDVLFNVAGILGDGQSTPGPERSLRGMDREWAMKSFQVNYLGPMFLTQACAPMMRKKKDEPKSVICNLSARVGSISDNGLGGWISYRASKSALNQGTKTLALELKRQGTYTIALHPGTTDTDLSKPFQKNVREDRLFPVDFTAERMIDAVDCMDDSHTGGFYDWNGTALPY
ncbi:hypothetical protein CTEN210_00333 [Chaetoceros tenuissimus]|uniref:Uncharacterized protein n=1 Tax=Chaetoceros tenuissimus TaxID=426638 RepID=A0AAD3CFU1_9STRA|nr:hypothetical protein CTEN210_00333 [Chaetoceros tenuissimus]